MGRKSCGKLALGKVMYLREMDPEVGGASCSSEEHAVQRVTVFFFFFTDFLFQ